MQENWVLDEPADAEVHQQMQDSMNQQLQETVAGLDAVAGLDTLGINLVGLNRGLKGLCNITNG